MWRAVWFFLGSCRVRITGGSPQWALERLSKARIAFLDTVKTDELTIETTILLRDLEAARRAAGRGMCGLEVLARRGLPPALSGLRKRTALVVMLLLTALSVIVLPKFVWFYEVSGNTSIPTQQILRSLGELGIGFGTYGPSIRPQWVKNHMLNRIPKLQWITITQNGAIAQVVVRERPDTEPVADRKTPRNVVASRDGLLTRVSVLEGGALCRTGDVVKAGQLLVSAYTDLGDHTQVSAALAEIYARTWRRVCARLPDTVLREKKTGRAQTCVSLILGRTRKIIFGKSGTERAECDKMTKTYRLTLPGGFSLPAAIEIAEISDYDTKEEAVDASWARAQLCADALAREKRDMIAGSVLKTDFAVRRTGGAYELRAVLECEEMIARMVDAEIFQNEGRE